MIKLNLKNKFKSLEPFQIELPDFVVLTGLNGAGKTQILNSIQGGQMTILDERNQQLNPKKYVTSQSLAPNNTAVVTRDQIVKTIQNLWNQFQGYLNNKRANPNYTLQSIFGNSNPPAQQIKTIQKISELSKKEIDDLKSEDFFNYYPIEEGFQQTDIFQQNFSNLFKRYQDKYDENEYRQYKFEKKGDTKSTFLSDEDFIETFGEAPWLFVNNILEEADLDYQIETPSDYNRDAPFQLMLVNKINGTQINFSDLSSGEKVLMSLALALYNSNFEIQFPKVLLMDEPDASLHPSMSKRFLDVIQEIFVEQKKVKVIITTHSPSTVALTPEENLYVVNKDSPRIEKASKDYALGILTSGVPSISINYENRRQIFVESENDVLFYDKIYRKITKHLHPEISLSFISSGDSRTDKNGIKVSNCDQVINISRILRESGNNLIWGIIDYDLKHKTDDYIKVIGDGIRYSIESYIFDTILVSALLLRQKIISRDDLGLRENQNYTDFKNLTEIELQRISDFIINNVSEKFDTNESELISVELINEKKIAIPKWYLLANGHQLEDKIIEVFPQLNAIKKDKEELLKIEMIDKVIDDIPSLLSKDFLDVFEYVQQ